LNGSKRGFASTEIRIVSSERNVDVVFGDAVHAVTVLVLVLRVDGVFRLGHARIWIRRVGRTLAAGSAIGSSVRVVGGISRRALVASTSDRDGPGSGDDQDVSE
jgi:hypothetical protein